MSTLEEIKARAEKATPGPWFRQYGDVITPKPDPRDIHSGAPRECRISHRAEHLDLKDAQGIKDAEFIAHARTDVPKLIAALEAVGAVEQQHVAHPDDGWAAGWNAALTSVWSDLYEALQ